MAVAPATATPIPNPTIPCSQSGVLKTRSFPGVTLREKHVHWEPAKKENTGGHVTWFDRSIFDPNWVIFLPNSF